MRPFLAASDFGGNSARAALAPSFPDYVEDVVLAADALVRVPIPFGAGFVVFSFDADFRAKIGVVATALTLPAATTADGTGAELNPAARKIPAFLGDGVTVPTRICLRSPAACKGSLSFYGG